MTGRQRLLTALDCGTPDRVPVNTYEMPGRDASSWYNRQPSYAHRMARIRQDTDCITNWGPAVAGDLVLGADGDTFLDSAFPVPVERRQERHGTLTRTTEVAHTPRGDLCRVLERDDRVLTTWQVEHWCKSVEDVDRALSVPFEPLCYDAADWPRLRAELGEHGLVMASLGDPAYRVADLMSFQDFTLWAHEHTEHYARAVDLVAERVMHNLERELATCTVDLYRICGPEYMTPPYLPPAMFQRFMVPHVRRMAQIIHEHGAKVRLHCHGRIGRVLDMFFDTGCDATDPCEPPPDGDLELDEVKRRCAARHVSVWGNLELKLLEHGSPADVRRAVQRCMDQAKAGGGYVILPTAAPINVPLAAKTESNYMAYIDAALEFGAY